MLHEVVSRGWPELSREVSLPPRVHAEVRRYLGCGPLARGFVQVQGDDRGVSRLVAFSCKGRGWWRSCAAKRTLESSTHLQDVLPRVGYRQLFGSALQLTPHLHVVLHRLLRQLRATRAAVA